jgi:hypothetical protein
MASQSAPGATRVVVSGPVANEMLAMMATSAAKYPAVTTISRVDASMRRSLPRTASVPETNPGGVALAEVGDDDDEEDEEECDPFLTTIDTTVDSREGARVSPSVRAPGRGTRGA